MGKLNVRELSQTAFRTGAVVLALLVLAGCGTRIRATDLGAIGSMQPPHGSVTGGESVTITFSSLNSALFQSATIGNSPCTITARTATTITCTTSANASDYEPQSVSLSALSGTISLANAFTYEILVGQASFTDQSINRGGAASSVSLNRPFRVRSDGTRLIVADANNNRVLIWNTIPTQANVAPDLILGQPDFTSSAANNGGLSASTLFTPTFAEILNGKLVVGDRGNHRILIWNTFPTVNGQPADLALGQTLFTTGTANLGGRSATTFNSPSAVAWIGGRFYVTDENNARILVWNSFPTTQRQAADAVIGQSLFTAGACRAVAQNAICNARGIGTLDGGRFYVADGDYNRVLIWNTPPAADGDLPDLVLGQPDFTTGAVNTGGISASTFSLPVDVAYLGGKFIVTDYNNHRVLVWNSFPTANGQAADAVIGQPNFVSSAANAGGSATRDVSSGPLGGILIGDDILVYSDENHRVISRKL